MPDQNGVVEVFPLEDIDHIGDVDIEIDVPAHQM
jgi:hypothetical protein